MSAECSSDMPQKENMRKRTWHKELEKKYADFAADDFAVLRSGFTDRSNTAVSPLYSVHSGTLLGWNVRKMCIWTDGAI